MRVRLRNWLVILAVVAGLGWKPAPARADVGESVGKFLGSMAAAMGTVQERAGHLGLAQTFYEDAVALAPGDWRMHWLLGRNLLRQYVGPPRPSPGRAREEGLKRARVELRRATELAPGSGLAWGQLGFALMGSYPPPPAAGEALEKAHRLLPEQLAVSLQLAAFYALTGQRSKADLLVQRARAEHGAPDEQVQIRDFLAQADFAAAETLIAAARIAEAAPLYERAAANTRNPGLRARARSMVAEIRTELSRQRFRAAYGEARALADRGDATGAIAKLEALLTVPQDSIDADQARSLLSVLRGRLKVKRT